MAQLDGNWVSGPVKIPSLLSEAGAYDSFSKGPAVRVFLVLGVDCPIANRYAPEIRRIVSDFVPKKVQFFRVYVESKANINLVRKHTREYQYSFPAFLDPDKQFIKSVGVRVTPEAVVINTKGEMVYRGRIDSRNIDHGKVRPDYRKDLRIAIQETLAGKPVTERSTAAIGCIIGN